MTEPLRIVFMGSDPIALPLLDWLAGEGSGIGKVVGVFTQPDRPSGRGQKIEPGAIKQWALARGLPVCQPEKILESDRQALAALNADVSLVMAYGQLLKDDFIATPRLGTLNLHASLLPKYRGASPIQTAVASGEKQTGVSLMRIVRKLDAGPVADAEIVDIGVLDTALDVEVKLSAACVPLLVRTLPKLRDGKLQFIEQEDARTSYCRRLQKEDGRLDFNRPSEEIAARINGLYPWPCCTIELAGVPIKVGLADTASGQSAVPGTVLGRDAEGLLIATQRGAVRLRKMQRPGGRMLPADEFLRGFAAPTGFSVQSAQPVPLVGSAPFRQGAPKVEVKKEK